MAKTTTAPTLSTTDQLATNLALLVPFYEGSGTTLHDISGVGTANTITLTLGTTGAWTTSDTALGPAVAFNDTSGTNGHADVTLGAAVGKSVGTAGGTAGSTIFGVFKSNGGAASTMAFGITDSNSTSYQGLRHNSDGTFTLYWDYGGGNHQITAAYSPLAGEYVTFAIVVSNPSGTTYKLEFWLNGVSQTVETPVTISSSASPAISSQTYTGFTIGGAGGAGSAPGDTWYLFGLAKEAWSKTKASAFNVNCYSSFTQGTTGGGGTVTEASILAAFKADSVFANSLTTGGCLLSPAQAITATVTNTESIIGTVAGSPSSAPTTTTASVVLASGVTLSTDSAAYHRSGVPKFLTFTSGNNVRDTVTVTGYTPDDGHGKPSFTWTPTLATAPAAGDGVQID